jgi:hypothetical protein
LRGVTKGTQRVSPQRHLATLTRAVLTAAIVVTIDGAAVGLAPAAALASTAVDPGATAATADAVPATSVIAPEASSGTVTTQASYAKTTVYTEASSRFAYHGSWSTARSSLYQGGRVKYTRTRGAYTTFTFTGKKVAWIGPVGPTRGKANVYLDGKFVRTVSQYSRTFTAQKLIFGFSWTSQKAHTLKVVALGTSGHPMVAIDSFRVTSLVSVPPPPTSPVTTQPSGGYRSSGPITVTSSNVVIDGVQVVSSGQSGIGIVAAGTSAHPINNITIRNCRVVGFRLAIEVRHATNVTVQNCYVSDADYVGIGYYSVAGGKIVNNTVQRIGTKRTNLSDNNAYGIIMDRYAGGTLTSDPRVSNVTVDHNLIEDVPLWMGINTHAGAHLTISNNIVRRTPRAIFIAGDGAGNQPIDIKILSNRLESPVTKSGGTQDIQGITISGVQGGSIIGNGVARAYGSPNGFDYLGRSTSIIRSGNFAI